MAGAPVVIGLGNTHPDFAALRAEAEGYVKTTVTPMCPVRAEVPIKVPTKEGEFDLPAGWEGWIAWDSDGDPYPIAGEVQATSYARPETSAPDPSAALEDLAPLSPREHAEAAAQLALAASRLVAHGDAAPVLAAVAQAHGLAALALHATSDPTWYDVVSSPVAR